jgi:ribosomal-protein-alanine N-acetyltransferase
MRSIFGRPEAHLAIEVNRELAGGIGLAIGCGGHGRTAELSYWLGEAFWGRGTATAAVRGVTRYAFRTLRLGRVFALPFAENRASCRVLEKAGFKREATPRGSARKRGVVHGQLVYALATSAFMDQGGVERADEAVNPRRSWR